jgi:chromosome segregation ATPase
MRNVHTLKDISSGHHLSSAREIKLEEMLCNSIKSISELTNEYNDMQGVYSSYSKRNDLDKAKLHRNLEQAEINNRKLSDRIHQLIDEMSQLRSEMNSLNFQITRKDISLAESKDKLATKSKEIKALQSKLKALEKNSSLAQMNLSEMDSLRLELEQANEDLNSKKHEIECMKKGIDATHEITSREIDALSSARLNLTEENSHI